MSLCTGVCNTEPVRLATGFPPAGTAPGGGCTILGDLAEPGGPARSPKLVSWASALAAGPILMARSWHVVDIEVMARIAARVSVNMARGTSSPLSSIADNHAVWYSR